MLILVIIIIFLIIEITIKPRIDFAGGRFLLWYGKKKRKYIVLINLNN